MLHCSVHIHCKTYSWSKYVCCSSRERPLQRGAFSTAAGESESESGLARREGQDGAAAVLHFPEERKERG